MLSRLWRRVCIYGCKHHLYHIGMPIKGHCWWTISFEWKWNGRINCWCEFWDAQ